MLGVVPGNVALLSACLKKACFKTKLFDASIYKTLKTTQDELRVDLNQVKKTNIDDYINYKKEDVFKDFRSVVKKYKPNLIAITLVDDTVAMGIRLLEKIKDFKILNVVGGVGVTFNYKKILSNKLINIACIGEGEEALVELCEKLYKGLKYDDIKNIYTKDQNGKIIKNPLRKLIDINKLPFYDFSIFDKTRFYRPFHGEVVRMGLVDTDRGCPYCCTYCAAPNLKNLYIDENVGKYFRTKSVDKIFKEIKHLKKFYDINFIWFSSETFFAREDEELNKFAKRYKEEINLPFWCQTRLDTFTDLRTKLLSEMGCRAVSVGLEHGSEQFRKNILKKYISNKSILNSFKLLKKYKIPVTVNNIVGFPDETRDLVFETIKINRIMNKYLVKGSTLNIFTFTPYSGTPLRELCIRKGYITKLTDDKNMYKTSVMKMPSMTQEEISGLQKTFPFYVKLPKKYYPMIKLAEKNNHLSKAKYQDLSRILKKYDR